MPERACSYSSGSGCSMRWGMCVGDARCQDLHCERHPVQGCSTCRGGPCVTHEACHLPIAQVRPITRGMFAKGQRLAPASREAWGRAIGAALGLGGFLLFAGDFLRRFFT